MTDELQSRFKTFSKPPALPGCCYVCRSADREIFVDLDAEVDDFNEYVGRLYLCGLCIENIARFVGLVPLTYAENYRRYFESLQDLNLDKAIEDLENVRGTLGDVVSNITGIWDNISTNNSSVPEADPDSEGTDNPAEDESREDDSEPTEPSPEPGLADFRSTGKFELNLSRPQI